MSDRAHERELAAAPARQAAASVRGHTVAGPVASPGACLACATGRCCNRHGLEREADAVAAAVGDGTVAAAAPGPGGAPLAEAVRGPVEAITGVGLGDVRVHSGPRATAGARAIGAAAYTRGSDIFLGDARGVGDTALLAHEATHAAQASRGPVPAVLARIDPTAMTVTTDDAAALSDEDLALAVADARAYLGSALAGDATYAATLENLTVLETEELRRPAPSSPVGLVDLASPPPPTAEDEAAQASLLGGMSVPEELACFGPEAPMPLDTGGMCYGPIAMPGLSRDAVLADYRTNARAFLTFILEASRQWADTVVRQQLTTDTGEVSEDAVTDLKSQGNVANDLAREAFRRRHIVVALDHLVEHHVPPEGTPRNSGSATVGSAEWIRGLDHDRIVSMGYPEEIPDLAHLVETLGMRPAVTSEEVDTFLVERATADDAWEAGMEYLESTGAVAWFPNADPEYQWEDRVYTDEEVEAIGWAHVHEDESARENARQLIELDPSRAEIDPEIENVIDPDPHAVDRNLTYDALRYVVRLVRADLQAQYALAQNALDTHLSQYPVLRMFVSNRAVLLNYLSTDTWMHGISYRPIIDVDAISSTSVMPKLETLLDEILQLEARIADDDDFLFDTAIQQSVAPLIQLYAEADPQYGRWIDDEFESNARWEEAMSDLLTIAAVLGFVVGSALTGGAAVPFLIAGIVASIGIAIRSSERADITGTAAHAGIGSREAAAVSHYQAWIDTAMAALGVLQGLVRGLGALGRLVAATEGEGGAIARLQIRIARVYQATGLTTAEMAQIQAWQNELEAILRRAVALVDSGQGQTRWSQILRNTPANSPRYAMVRGNAVHAEAFEMLGNSRGTTLPSDMAWNRGVAMPDVNLPNRYPGRLPTSRVPMRPDVRIALPGGREVVFDFTTMGNLGHSAAYGNNSWVATVIELGY
jgi:hypothetical protein